MLKQTLLDTNLLAAVERAHGVQIEEGATGNISWYSIKKWEDGSPHYDKIDSITTGTDGPGHHLEYGENHDHPEHVIGVRDGAPKSAEAKEYLDKHAEKYTVARENFISAMRKAVKPLNEGSLRLVKDGHHTHESGRSAKVYKDAEWNEHRVKFFDEKGNHMKEADYHTDDAQDAHDTAKHWLEKGK